MLQEYLQAQKLPLPEYQLLKTTGEDHKQLFYIKCYIQELNKFAEGTGLNRRKAEQEAAKNLLQKFIM